jgi:hypothetical protein
MKIVIDGLELCCLNDKEVDVLKQAFKVLRRHKIICWRYDEIVKKEVAK